MEMFSGIGTTRGERDTGLFVTAWEQPAGPCHGETPIVGQWGRAAPNAVPSLTYMSKSGPWDTKDVQAS